MNADELYREYILKAESLGRAIESEDWEETGKILQWREAALREIFSQKVSSEHERNVHRNWIPRMMVIDHRNTELLSEHVEKLKNNLKKISRKKPLLAYSR